ncbi:MAG: hypothetical protein JXR37_22395 [Kiritimatiellae bacterium]|nr:hypothetical protein [Kiritimatiellia bacterium]
MREAQSQPNAGRCGAWTVGTHRPAFVRNGSFRGAGTMKAAGRLVAVWLAVLCRAAPLAAAEPIQPERFGREEESRRQEVADQLQAARRKLRSVRLNAEQRAALEREIGRLMAERDRLEAWKADWHAHVKANPLAETGAELGAPTDSGRWLDMAQLFTLYKQFAACRHNRWVHTSGTAGPDSSAFGRQRPTAKRWLALAEAFDTVLRIQSPLSGPPATPLYLRGVLLQGACYLNASVEHCRAGDEAAQVRDHLAGVRLVERALKLATSVGGSAQMPARDSLDGAPDAWPVATEIQSGDDVPTEKQARELLADFCPWGVTTYMHLRGAGLTRGLNWAVLRPYAEPFTGREREKLSSAEVRTVPKEVADDMQKVVGGTFQLGGSTATIKWLVPPRPTYTVWCVTPDFHEMSPGEQLALLLKAVKLVKAGPLALILDEAKGLAAHHFGSMWGGAGSPAYCAWGHISNFLDLSLVDGHWMSPGAVVKGSMDATAEDPVKGAFMAAIAYYEDKEAEALYEGTGLKDPRVVGHFGYPLTWDGDPMPAVMIRADVLGFEPRPEGRYARAWHVIRYYRLDTRAVEGLRGLAETPAGEADRKKRTFEGTQQGVGAPWKRLPDQPQTWGTRVCLLDFTPLGQLVEITFPTVTEDTWRLSAGRDVALVAELALPGRHPRRAPAVSEIRDHRALFLLDNSLHVTDMPDEWARLPTRVQPFFPLFKEYRVRVVEAERGGQYGWKVDRGETRAEFAVRLTPERGKAITGKVSYPIEGYIKLEQEYGKVESVDVAASGALPMQPRIGLLLSTRRGADPEYTERDDVVQKSNPGAILALTAHLTPAPTQWRRLNVQIAERSYVFWDYVERIGQPAVFDVLLPVPPGRHTVTFTATGQGAACSRRLTVDAPAGDDSYNRDWLQRSTAEMERHRLIWEDEDRSAGTRLESLAWMLRNKVSVGQYLTWLYRYPDAVECFESIVRTREPARLIAEVQNPDDSLEVFDETREQALAWLPQVGLFMNRKDIVIDYGRQWIQARQRRIETPRRTMNRSKPSADREAGGEPATEAKKKPSTHDQYVGLANDAARILRWYVMLGGVGGRNEVRGKYEEFLSKAGYYDPEYDPLRYVYRK